MKGPAASGISLVEARSFCLGDPYMVLYNWNFLRKQEWKRIGQSDKDMNRAVILSGKMDH
ncbi:hypothetical protein D3C84_1224180 [compost metagenome]